jgi:3-methyladenine DNA glycosylase AlkD
MQIQELYVGIVRQLEQLAKSETGLEKRLRWSKEQHKTPGIAAHGISTPTVRKLIRRFLSQFRQLDLKDKFALATLLYESGNFEQATIGDTLVELNLPHLTPVHFDLFDEVVGHFNNWASVDWLCLHG